LANDDVFLEDDDASLEGPGGDGAVRAGAGSGGLGWLAAGFRLAVEDAGGSPLLGRESTGAGRGPCSAATPNTTATETVSLINLEFDAISTLPEAGGSTWSEG